MKFNFSITRWNVSQKVRSIDDMMLARERKIMRFLSTIAMVSTIGATLAFAPAVQAANKGPSGLPLPRYVSLKASRVNMRVGPGRDYKVDWMFTKRGLPLEILQEFDNWRKVRDPEGSEGWILQSLLSGERTAIVAPWKRDDADKLIKLKRTPTQETSTVARLEAGVVAKVDECSDGWCKMSVKGVEGYVEQASLWGVYPDENLD